ncbi:MAG: hypothetical protein ACRDMV_25330 [Streptosporangiales bacterium]
MATFPPLATAADLDDRGIAHDESTVNALLEDASVAVRNYTHQVISYVMDDTAEIVPQGAWVTLPQRPVDTTSLTTVTLGGREVTGWKRIRDRLWLAGGWPPWGPSDTRFFFPDLVQQYVVEPVAVEVTYSHGYETVPGDVVAVVCGAIARALASPNDLGVSSKTVGSVSIHVASPAGVIGLLREEKRILNRYRRSVHMVPQR